MIGFLMIVSCREEGICTAPEPLKTAIVVRTGKSCEDVQPSSMTHLHMSNYPHPIEDVSILSRFVSLKELRLSDTKISDISFVSHMPQLSILHLDHSEVHDISPLYSNLMLEELWLDYSKVVDLTPLKNLKKLRILTLRESKILDIYPLRSMEKLEVLDISNTSIFDLSPLKNIGSLQAVSIRNTQVDDIGSLSKHTHLRLLDMRKTRVSDLYPLSSLSKLTALDAGQNRIEHIPSMPSLEEFRIDGNPLATDGCRELQGVPKEECIRSMTNQQDGFVNACIRRDQLSFHQETTIESLLSVFQLKNCSQLAKKIHGSIDIRGVPILDMRLLEEFPLDNIQVDIDWIWPEFCPQKTQNKGIQDICVSVHQKVKKQVEKSELAFLRLCKEATDDDIRTTLSWMMESTNTQSCIRLWMSGSQKSEWEVSRKGVSSLSPFAFFPNLKALLLDYNDIVDLSPLSLLPQLQILWLDDNRILDISALNNNQKLLWLGLGDNEILDLSVLSSLPHIRRLWLGGNDIREISSLSSLYELRKLHLAGNQIQDVSPLSSLPFLERLYLADNKITDARPLSSLHKLQFLTVGLDYEESPLEAHHWLLRGNPIVHCPQKSPLPIQLACSFVED